MRHILILKTGSCGALMRIDNNFRLSKINGEIAEIKDQFLPGSLFGSDTFDKIEVSVLLFCIPVV